MTFHGLVTDLFSCPFVVFFFSTCDYVLFSSRVILARAGLDVVGGGIGGISGSII